MSQRRIDVHEAVAGVPDHSFAEACEVLEHVADKWSIGVVVAAAHGPVRFSELNRAIHGISPRMLTVTLRKLERDGLLVRTVYPTAPPRVEYNLTPLARELQATLANLVQWAERHRITMALARSDYDNAVPPQATGA